MSNQDDTEHFDIFDVDIGVLINIVKKIPHLYDNRLLDYKNVLLRTKTWEKIAATLKIPSEECQRLWRNLRDKYGKERNKVKSGTIPSSKWEFYSSLEFLGPHIRRRRRSSKRGFGSFNKIEYKFENDEGRNGSSWKPIEVDFSSRGVTVIDGVWDENEETEEITLETELPDSISLKKENESMNESLNFVRHQTSEEAFGAYIASRLMDFDIDDRQTKKVKIFKILEDLDIETN